MCLLKRVTRHRFDDDMNPLVDGKDFAYMHEYPDSLSMGDDKMTCIEW